LAKLCIRRAELFPVKFPLAPLRSAVTAPTASAEIIVGRARITAESRAGSEGDSTEDAKCFPMTRPAIFQSFDKSPQFQSERIMKRRITIVVVAVTLLVACTTKKNTVVPESRFEVLERVESVGGEGCPTTLAACPAEGCGARPDTGTNRQKNRTVVPTETVEMSVAEFKSQHHEISSIGRSREGISDSDQSTLDVEEGVGVTVDGYILDDKMEGPESCNCGIDGAFDYHVWLGARASSEKSASIVVELTPRIFFTTDPDFKALMSRLKHDHAHVRVTGWPMFDPLHPDQIGNTRYSRWEVHPITDIEEEQNDGTFKSVFQ
jgi:hypothetical protein